MQLIKEMEEARRAHKLDNYVILITKTNSGHTVVNECVQMCVNERTGLREKVWCVLQTY